MKRVTVGVLAVVALPTMFNELSVALPSSDKKAQACPSPERLVSTVMGSYCLPSLQGVCAPGRNAVKGILYNGMVCVDPTAAPLVCDAPETKRTTSVTGPDGAKTEIEFCAPGCAHGRELRVVSASPVVVACDEIQKRPQGGELECAFPEGRPENQAKLPPALASDCLPSKQGVCAPGRTLLRAIVSYSGFGSTALICRTTSARCPAPELAALDENFKEACRASAAGKCGPNRVLKAQPKGTVWGPSGENPRYCIDRGGADVATIVKGGPGNVVIEVLSGTYGANCAGVSSGNSTSHVANACNGKTGCAYTIDYRVIGDAKPGCGKNFVATYRCGAAGPARTETVAPEAGFGKVLRLSCGN